MGSQAQDDNGKDDLGGADWIEPGRHGGGMDAGHDDENIYGTAAATCDEAGAVVHTYYPCAVSAASSQTR